MIRFLPDTWLDAVMRPIAIAAPDAAVYVEIMAPDIRFAAITALILIWIFISRHKRWSFSPLTALTTFVLTAFCVWLATTGNGRYFLTIFLVAGPLCIALIYKLPSTRVFKLAIAFGVVALQTLIVYQNNPWHWWALAPWDNAPFFQVALDKEALAKPSTYVTVTPISYSLLISRFPLASRWINISDIPEAETTADGKRIQSILASSDSLMLLIPSIPEHMTADLKPNKAMSAVINDMLVVQRLALKNPFDCRLLPSKGLASQAFKNIEVIDPKLLAKFGFWICPLQYPVASHDSSQHNTEIKVNKIFERIESLCPRFFQPGQTLNIKMTDGFMRNYRATDIKLYLFNDGSVLYKYWKALSPTLIGSSESIMNSSFKMDCDAINGRSGLPWDRKL